MLRVCIADDHRLVRSGIRAALTAVDGVEVAGEAAAGDEVMAMVDGALPDVVLLDLRMPGLDGLQCLRAIKQRHPGIFVVMLSASEAESDISAALEAGASAYIGKRVNPADIASVLRQVVEGTVYHGERPAPAVRLTDRERTILDALARGLSTKAISRELWISEKTVKFHLTNIYRKLDVSNRTSALRYAYDHGLIERVDSSVGA